MKIIDISMTIEMTMQVYKNRDVKKPQITVDSDHISGSAHETRLNMNMHTGTHVDAPLHMMAGGQTMEVYDLEQFVGKARVLDFSQLSDRVIKKSDLLEKFIEQGDIVLLKTANSTTDEFEFDFVYLSGEAAAYLSSVGVKAVGIDALGIERNAPGHPAHKALLENNIPIIEGLRLADAAEGIYEFIGLPVKIAGVEASPLRAILIDK